jgi:hypothetical protein
MPKPSKPMTSKQETTQKVFQQETHSGCTITIIKYMKGRRVVNYGWELNMDFFGNSGESLFPDLGAAELIRQICVHLGASKTDIQKCVDMGHWHHNSHLHCYFSTKESCYNAAVAVQAAFQTMRLGGVGFYKAYREKDVFSQAYENAMEAQRGAYVFGDFPDEVPL